MSSVFTCEEIIATLEHMTQPSVNFITKIKRLPIEEKIINSAYIVTIVSVFLPWLAGTYASGETIAYNGFSFHAGVMGLTSFLLAVFCLAIKVTPLVTNKQLVRINIQPYVRFHTTAASLIIILCVISVYTSISWEIELLEIYFGLYLNLASTIVASVYTFLLWRTDDQNRIEHIFEEVTQLEQELPPEPKVTMPPPAPAALDHKPFGNKRTK